MVLYMCSPGQNIEYMSSRDKNNDVTDFFEVTRSALCGVLDRHKGPDRQNVSLSNKSVAAEP